MGSSRENVSKLQLHSVDLGTTKTRNAEQIKNASVRDTFGWNTKKEKQDHLKLERLWDRWAPSRARDRDPAGVAAARPAPPPGSPPASSTRGAWLTNGDKADPTTSPRRGPRPGRGARRWRTGPGCSVLEDRPRPPAGRASLRGAPRARDAETSKGARPPARPALRARVPGVSLAPPPPRSSRTGTGVPARSPPPSRQPPALAGCFLPGCARRAPRLREPRAAARAAATAPPAPAPAAAPPPSWLRSEVTSGGAGRATSGTRAARAVAEGRDPRLRRPRRASTGGPRPRPHTRRGLSQGRPGSEVCSPGSPDLGSRWHDDRDCTRPDTRPPSEGPRGPRLPGPGLPPPVCLHQRLGILRNRKLLREPGGKKKMASPLSPCQMRKTDPFSSLVSKGPV
ncbi:unnamed protein product [Rangifer tarandus platyrhynchus]|uniref:Uncharacterized protein n=2 Tax=Rangifer tarandus platyrhynchus TaxID=3082113 RepID=A0ACB0FMW5_RANTA|nr:unnamed protein product [Rangifer tarandus platyrhynchus]CAI9714118.1 unnamed protein product [Rangifer tarandus platyrhynchus]